MRVDAGQPRRDRAGKRLVGWESLRLLVDGGRMTELAGEIVAKNQIPVESLVFHFAPGMLAIEGKVRKGIAVPFRVTIREIAVEANVVTVPLGDIAAFGFLPVPAILFRIIEEYAKLEEGIHFSSRPPLLAIALDRFLPSFIDTTVTSIRLIDGGFEVNVGSGGADLPAGGLDGILKPER